MFCSKINWQADKRRFASVGENSKIQYPATFFGMKYICIENNSSAKSRLQLEAYDNMFGVSYMPLIRIGDNVLIASKVFITDYIHGDNEENTLKIAPLNRHLYSKGKVVIEDDVWIGESVAIMPGHMGHNSVIDANSVVTHDVEPYSIVAGVPAKVIKQYTNIK